MPKAAPRKKAVHKNQLVGDPVTQDYTPGSWLPWYLQQRQRPFFMPTVHVPLMLPDARIQFGIGLIFGAIKSLTKYEVVCENAGVQEYLTRQVDRFFQCGLIRALRCVPWGWSANEILYDEQMGDDGPEVVFDALKDLQCPDVRAVSYKSNLVGCTIKGAAHYSSSGLVNAKSTMNKLFLGGPKLLWCVHRRDINPFYGLARLHGAFLPWWEKWSEGGYRDMRRLWYYAHCFRGPLVRHPVGSEQKPDGSQISHKDIARTIGEWIRSGAGITLPSTKYQDGTFLWEIEDSKGNDTPGGLEDYGNDINLEMFEGLGIPEEVAVSESQGLGSTSGRSIPMVGFLSSLQDIVEWVFYDFSEQCLKTLVYLKFKDDIPFSIKVAPLIDEFLPSGGEGDVPVDEEGNPMIPEDENGNPLKDQDKLNGKEKTPNPKKNGKPKKEVATT